MNPREEGRDAEIKNRAEAASPPSLDDASARPGDRALLIAVRAQRSSDGLHELSGLCETAGIEVLGEQIQVRRHPSPSTYLGKGKIEELGEQLESADANLVVCDEELAPVQARNLERSLGVRVLDRSELILAIFDFHAQTTQARLQVELAQAQYQLPRLRRLWTHLDRERGGTLAMGGMGEKQITIDRRLLRRKIQGLRKKLQEIEARKRREIASRRSEFLVSLVGYTNAGKSTFMNRVTGSSVLEEDKLFSTLDTRTKRWMLGEGRQVLLSDTVGFIKNIPHKLVASFHATLAEALEADLLLVVVDASDAELGQRIETVHEVLEEIGAGGKEVLRVLNKIDRDFDPAELTLLRARYPDAFCVSARTGEGVEALADAVRERLEQYSRELWVEVPHALAALQSQIHQNATIQEERHLPDAAYFRVLATPKTIAVLESKGVKVVEEAPGRPTS